MKKQSVLFSILALVFASLACQSVMGIGNGAASTLTPITSAKDGMTMVFVPAGEFLMGSTPKQVDKVFAHCQKVTNNQCQRGWFTAEMPQHQVMLDAYYIDQTEVTNAMYAKCVSDGACKEPSNKGSFSRPSYYGNSEFNNYPVIYVDWNMAKNYCEWRGDRLPTEAQWEKAASWDDASKTKRIYPWGNSIDCSHANYYDTENNKKCMVDTTAVKSYPSGRSFYGAYDMTGNVWEFVSDWYDVYPGGDKNASSNFGQTYHGLRGGSWNNDIDVRSTFRDFSNPGGKGNHVGFRCAHFVP
jgi:formylglycine-generating enzyme required for sulfatase activity